MEDKSKLYTITVLIALAGVLVSLIVSCFAGSIAGYWIGSRQAQQVAEKLLREREGIERPKLIVPPELFERELEPFRRTLSGAVVQYVEPGGPAEKAGLEEGDVITALDGQEVDKDHPLDKLINRYKPGDSVEITYWRGDQEHKVRVRLGEHPEEKIRAYLGIRFFMQFFEQPED
ncbi:MAG: PDZ domain-containing protein [Anaerolineae bacterium]